MPAIQPACHLLNLVHIRTPTKELRLFEAETIACLVIELKEIFRKRYEPWITTTHSNKEEVYRMIDNQFLKDMLFDILSSGNYTLEGIARYTGFHEDLISDIASGICPHPSIFLFQKLFELHLGSKHDLYKNIRKKIISQMLEKDVALQTLG